jgi:phage terminase Nu1 subunit (DNA packaging protein)
MNLEIPIAVTVNRLLKKKEIAAILGVSPRTIDNWVMRRTIPYIAASPRLHLFDAEAVLKVVRAKFEVCER